MQIEAIRGVANRRIDDRVIITGEEIDALVCDVSRVIDVAAARPLIGLGDQRVEGWWRPRHARTGRRQGGSEIAEETSGCCALRTVIRAASDDPDPLDYRRPCHPELHRHKGAGRNALNQALFYVR